MKRLPVSLSSLLLGLFFMGMSAELSAEVTLPQVLGSHMVLQRNEIVKIWGWADKGEKVSVTFKGQKAKAKTGKDGRWMVQLEPMVAGGPYEMTISGKNEILLEDILVGDVWICSGQSNMEWTVSNSNDADEEISQGDHPLLRLFNVPHNIQLQPVDDIPEAAWMACSPETVGNFSAVGYFFGRKIHQEMEVPVGLISTNWGGTNVETWISREMALTIPGMKGAVESIDGMDMEVLKEQMEKERQEILGALGALEPGMVDGNPAWAAEELDLGAWKGMEVPGLWEDQGLKGVDGVVWFRKTIKLEEADVAGGAILSLGAIDDSDLTWINGVEVGQSLNQYNAVREYQVPEGILKAGVNTVAVRVEDTGGGGGFWGEPEKVYLKTEAGVHALAGEWLYRVSSEGFSVNMKNTLSPNAKPTLLYNGMIHPLLNFRVLGAIWYQGESNASRAYSYRTRFPNMIMDWRDKWENQDLGFYFVQLANFMQPRLKAQDSEWAELREAQLMTLSLSKTGMAVAIDIGEADDIHPRNKQDVGQRLALAALHDTYGKDVVYSGPVLKEMKTDGSKVILEFDPMGSGLKIKDKYGYVMGFALAGEDRVFHWAKGKLDGNSIILGSQKVKSPVAVRYGWADNPGDVNLYNKEGLPASPFRTDDWPGITMEK